jgi:hypothetical protein
LYTLFPSLPIAGKAHPEEWKHRFRPPLLRESVPLRPDRGNDLASARASVRCVVRGTEPQRAARRRWKSSA